MKKSTTVRYSSEEVKKLPDRSDWEANAAMTDEEIMAAIASDPDDAEFYEWPQRTTAKRPEERVDMFIAVYDNNGQLTMRRIAKLVPDKEKKSSYVRVVDETGRSYLVPMEVPEDTAPSLEQKLK